MRNSTVCKKNINRDVHILLVMYCMWFKKKLKLWAFPLRTKPTESKWSEKCFICDLHSTVSHHSMRFSTSWKTSSDSYGFACLWLLSRRLTMWREIILKCYYGDIFCFRNQPVCLQAVLGQYGSRPAGQIGTCFHLHSETTEIILLKSHISMFFFLCKGIKSFKSTYPVSHIPVSLFR